MPLPNPKPFTFSDLLAWPDSERTELIRGVPVAMAPPTRQHQKIVRELFGQLWQYLQDKPCEVYTAPFAVRPFQQSADSPDRVDTVVEPDITVVCDPGKLDDAGCKGAPDLVIEVVSPSTARHDRFTKYNLYEQAGVREYWLADPGAEAVQVFLLEDGRFSNAAWARFGQELPVNVLEGCVIRLEGLEME